MVLVRVFYFILNWKLFSKLLLQNEDLLRVRYLWSHYPNDNTNYQFLIKVNYHQRTGKSKSHYCYKKCYKPLFRSMPQTVYSFGMFGLNLWTRIIIHDKYHSKCPADSNLSLQPLQLNYPRPTVLQYPENSRRRERAFVLPLIPNKYHLH